MEKDLRNNVKFILFCTECLQAGVVMTPKEYEVAFMAAEKFEGFDDKSFENMKPEQFAPRMNAMLQAMSKRKHPLHDASRLSLQRQPAFCRYH